MARKPIPLEQRVTEAKVRTRTVRALADAPAAAITTIDDVPELSVRARKHWPRFRALLKALPVVAESDLLTVQRMVETYAEIRHYMEIIKAEGPFYTSRTKEGEITRAHPAVGALADADRRFHSYLTDFGLTPAARSKVQGNNDGNEKDPLSEFIS